MTLSPKKHDAGFYTFGDMVILPKNSEMAAHRAARQHALEHDLSVRIIDATAQELAPPPPSWQDRVRQDMEDSDQ